MTLKISPSATRRPVCLWQCGLLLGSCGSWWRADVAWVQLMWKIPVDQEETVWKAYDGACSDTNWGKHYVSATFADSIAIWKVSYFQLMCVSRTMFSALGTDMWVERQGKHMQQQHVSLGFSTTVLLHKQLIWSIVLRDNDCALEDKFVEALQRCCYPTTPYSTQVQQQRRVSICWAYQRREILRMINHDDNRKQTNKQTNKTVFVIFWNVLVGALYLHDAQYLGKWCHSTQSECVYYMTGSVIKQLQVKHKKKHVKINNSKLFVCLFIVFKPGSSPHLQIDNLYNYIISIVL